jgi:hypothetical protein
MLVLQPREVLNACHSAGLSIAVTPDQGLKLTPKSAITPELRETLKAYKSVLVDYLSHHAANAPSIEPSSREPATEVKEKPLTSFHVLQGWRREAETYHLHHFKCKWCMAAGQGRGQRCNEGQSLHDSYLSAFDTATGLKG